MYALDRTISISFSSQSAVGSFCRKRTISCKTHTSFITQLTMKPHVLSSHGKQCRVTTLSSSFYTKHGFQQKNSDNLHSPTIPIALSDTPENRMHTRHLQAQAQTMKLSVDSWAVPKRALSCSMHTKLRLACVSLSLVPKKRLHCWTHRHTVTHTTKLTVGQHRNKRLHG